MNLKEFCTYYGPIELSKQIKAQRKESPQKSARQTGTSPPTSAGRVLKPKKKKHVQSSPNLGVKAHQHKMIGINKENLDKADTMLERKLIKAGDEESEHAKMSRKMVGRKNNFLNV